MAHTPELLVLFLSNVKSKPPPACSGTLDVVYTLHTSDLLPYGTSKATTQPHDASGVARHLHPAYPDM